MPDIVVKLEFDSLRVYIKNTLHVHIRRSDLLGVQSWQWPNYYAIEYVMKGGTVLTEYTEIETWLSILTQLQTLQIT